MLSDRFAGPLYQTSRLADRMTERECERNCAEKICCRSRSSTRIFAEIRRTFIEQWNCDLLGVFRQLRGTGAVEIMASAATHAIPSDLAAIAGGGTGTDCNRVRSVSETFGGEPSGLATRMRLFRWNRKILAGGKIFAGSSLMRMR